MAVTGHVRLRLNVAQQLALLEDLRSARFEGRDHSGSDVRDDSAARSYVDDVRALG